MHKTLAIIIGAVFALSGCATGTDGNEPPTSEELWNQSNEIQEEAEVASDYDCDNPDLSSKWGKALYELHCPEQFKAEQEAQESWDAFTEEYGYEPGAGTPLNPDADYPYDNDAGGSGGCVWDPTMNYDWHDDYVCGGVRQYFLPNDNYVEQWEIDAEAQEWEARNG